METKFTNKGFSLTEVLMAVGILSIGMMLIATMFPVGIYLTGVGAERTMAAIVADEAFAKIQLYNVNLASPKWAEPRDANCTPYEDVTVIDPNEFSYPSTDPCSAISQYYWSALCRRTNPTDPNMLFQVTVFVARKTGASHTYNLGGEGGKRPKAIVIDCNLPVDANELTILGGNERYVNPPTTILDNVSGRLYEIVNRDNNIVRLDRRWDQDTADPNYIWLIPPPDTGGKNADVEVYQRIIRF